MLIICHYANLLKISFMVDHVIKFILLYILYRIKNRNIGIWNFFQYFSMKIFKHANKLKELYSTLPCGHQEATTNILIYLIYHILTHHSILLFIHQSIFLFNAFSVGCIFYHPQILQHANH